MRETWNGLLKIIEIQHLDRDGTVLWKDSNVHNVLHVNGEQFLLNALFVGGNSGFYIPDNYYFGLDARGSVLAADTITDLAGEPQTNGYSRQLVSSLNQFSVAIFGGIYQAVSPIVSFGASGGSWGPVTNLFLTTDLGSAGTLISSVPLSQSLTVIDGQVVSLKMGLSLRDVPPA